MLSTILNMLESRRNFKDMKVEPWAVAESEVSSNVQNTLLKDKDSVKVSIAEYQKEDLSFQQNIMLKAQSVEKKKSLLNAISWMLKTNTFCLIKLRKSKSFQSKRQSFSLSLTNYIQQTHMKILTTFQTLFCLLNWPTKRFLPHSLKLLLTRKTHQLLETSH